MRRFRSKLNNNGFSMIELIVIMAIMTVAAGALILSVSLITGSEAKKAARKVDAMLNEVKTGAMSRADEDITIVYKFADAATTSGGTEATGDIDRDGFYAVKDIKTLTFSGTSSGTPSGDNTMRYGVPGKKSLGQENRLLCDDRVSFTLYYNTGSGATTSGTTLSDQGTNRFTIKYDRGTGLYEPVEIDGVPYGTPIKLVMTSGGAAYSYTIEFDNDTGRHSLKKN